MRKLTYFLMHALSNMRNNSLVHLIGVSTMAISILLLGAFILLYINVYGWVEALGGSVRMSIYLKDEITQRQLHEVRELINGRSEVRRYYYVSKEKALQELKKALGDQSRILSALSTNPLPASFELEIITKADRTRQLEGLARELKVLQGVQDVQYTEAWLERVRDGLRIVKAIGFVVGGLLALGALFIVTNTIKLTIYSRKEEIEIMKLVGATDWFVKAPFILEGMIQGVLSAVAAMGILYLGFLLFSVKKATLLNFATLELNFMPWSYMANIVGLSLVVGAIGSFIAVGRFFEVSRT